MNHLQNETIEDAEIVLTNKEHNYLGPDLVLKNCRIILDNLSARKALTITKVKLIDCRIEAKKRLVNCQDWCRAFLKGCSFFGTFVGNDFGHWEESFGPDGGLEDCDFSKAILDGCRFMNCDIKTIKLPSWPCFTILNPVERLKDMQAIEWPGKLEFWIQCASDDPAGTVAVTSYAPEVVKKFGGSEAELKAILEDLEYVRL